MILRITVTPLGTRTAVVFDRAGKTAGAVLVTHEIMRLKPGWYDAGSLRPLTQADVPWLDEDGELDMRGAKGV